MITLDLDQIQPLIEQLGLLKNFFLYTFSGFTQPKLGPFGDIEGLVQLKPGTYNSEKPIEITGIDNVHLKCDCFNGGIVSGC